MQQTNRVIACPVCGQKLEVVIHPTKPGRVVAYDDCQGRQIGVVAVWEGDAIPDDAPKVELPKEKDGK